MFNIQWPAKWREKWGEKSRLKIALGDKL